MVGFFRHRLNVTLMHVSTLRVYRAQQVKIDNFTIKCCTNLDQLADIISFKKRCKPY